MVATVPHFDMELAAWARGLLLVSGVDEAGRGPLAGPVVAAAVILNPSDIPAGLNDSKVLSATQRQRLFVALARSAMVSVGVASVAEIDRLNILQAAHLAMCRAVAGLLRQPDHVLIDGPVIPRDLTIPAQAVIGGDRLSLSIAAASIVAKTWRDALMVDLAQQYPGYGWEKNAGYPTRSHKIALQNLGVTPHHRRSFKPVHHILYQEKNLSD